ncbi:unnamed protein product, partial [Adineta ricciae]
MAQATGSAKSTTASAAPSAVIREMTSSFARSLADENPSLIRQSLDRLRTYIGDSVDSDENISKAF